MISRDKNYIELFNYGLHVCYANGKAWFEVEMDDELRAELIKVLEGVVGND